MKTETLTRLPDDDDGPPVVAMKESERLEPQLTDLQGRRDNWANEVTRAASRLSQARQLAIAGSDGSAAEVTAAQSEHSALLGLLSEADDQLARLRADLQAARHQEAMAAVERRLAELNAQRKENIDSYDARLAALNDFLSTSISELSEGQQREAALYREVTSLGGALEIPPLGARRWSDSGLKYASHIAQMIAEAYRERERAARKGEPTRAA